MDAPKTGSPVYPSVPRGEFCPGDRRRPSPR